MIRFFMIPLVVFALSTTSRAKAEVIERVVAVVNDQAIFLSELRTRAFPFLAQISSAATESERLGRLEQVYSTLIKAMIDEEVLSQNAAQAGISVTTQEVDRAMANIREQNAMDEDSFISALSDQGLTLSTYRKTLRGQLIRLKLINERVRSRVNITDEQVRREYEDRARRSGTSLRFRVSHFVLPLAPGASASEVAKVRDAAARIHKGLKPEAFGDAMQEYGGSELGWLTQGDLPEELETALLALETGQISEPTRGSTGYHIFFLHERSTASELPPFAEAKEGIFNELHDQSMERQQTTFLEELRNKSQIRQML